ncbi:hypothetical protein [Nonomuraea sp. NPDC049695]|uniref:hypothetical protein n=1 Tax=Nonomuraea sp. NPDC049695 TaxID=3154734 RepID=UPI00343D377A
MRVRARLDMILSRAGLYVRLLITRQPLTPAYCDRLLQAVFVGMGAQPQRREKL